MPDVQNIFTLLQNSNCVADLFTLQPRMRSALSLLCPTQRQHFHPKFMLLKAPESELLFSLLQKNISSLLPLNNTGYAYHINEKNITLSVAQSQQDNFVATNNCLSASWVDNVSLFGCVRQPEDNCLKLQSGLVHHANGGILILGLRTLLSQPTLWGRLKQMVINGEYQWFSTDDSNPLPMIIPSMPLDLRLVLVGDRLSLAELQDFEPEFYDNAIYAEFEDDVVIKSESDIQQWVAWVKYFAQHQNLPDIDNTAFAELIKAGVKFTEDQSVLPLSLDWLNTQLINAAQFAKPIIDAEVIRLASAQKNWRESYLVERFREPIINNQIVINTQDQIIGQINALTVIEYPGYPNSIGEPTRLSCLIHYGDGEFVDIERKNDLAGSIHSKSMMIMQAFITAEFAITHQLPFSASLVFEQSYNEIDGDSASLAGLCVLISALSQQPIDQQLAVTGSVDQFGHVQAVGGINEKIEGFFDICQHQGLTGQQGVIIPASNQRHLCLKEEVIMAIKNQQFSIWAIDHVADALYLLTGIVYKDENPVNLYKLIQSRIQTLMNYDRRPIGWFSKWRK